MRGVNLSGCPETEKFDGTVSPEIGSALGYQVHQHVARYAEQENPQRQRDKHPRKARSVLQSRAETYLECRFQEQAAQGPQPTAYLARIFVSPLTRLHEAYGQVEEQLDVERPHGNEHDEPVPVGLLV